MKWNPSHIFVLGPFTALSCTILWYRASGGCSGTKSKPHSEHLAISLYRPTPINLVHDFLSPSDRIRYPADRSGDSQSAVVSATPVAHSTSGYRHIDCV